MHVQILVRALALALVLGHPQGSAAQSESPTAPPVDAPPHLMRLDGAGAELTRDATTSTLEPGDPVLFGDRLDSGQAFAQLLWGDGSRIALDRGTRIEALAGDLLAVTAGRVLVIRPAAASSPLRVDTPAASLLLASGGEYRVELDGDVTTLGVVRGHADVQTGMGDQSVEAGQQLALRDGLAPEAPHRFNAAGYDSFAEWARAPSTAPAAGAPLETFQDPRFEAYSDVFNRHGTWETDPQFGVVWFPQVGGDWRPYADGYWQSWGPQSQWLWVGRDPWGWPTHHFGRWGANGRGRWFWMPGRQWGPAWVDWSVGPGYIGWTPLGASDRPQAAWNDFSRRPGAHAGGTLDPGRAWTVVPSDHFGQRGRLGAYAVDPRTLDLSAFVTQRTGPPVRYGGSRGGTFGAGASGISSFGGPGSTTMYGPGGYYGGVNPRTGGAPSAMPRGPVGPTRVGPPAPGYGGPTPPPEDPYERAQRAVAPRSRQRTPPREGPADAPPPAARESAPAPAGAARESPPPARPAAEPKPPVPDSTPPAASTGRATGTTSRAVGTTTGRRAIPRPQE